MLFPATLLASIVRKQKAKISEMTTTKMWADGQRDGRPAEYRWRHLFNAAKFG